MNKKRFFLIFLILLLIFPLVAQTSIAKADDLVIQDDGKIILVITNNGVLGVTTSAPAPVTTANKSAPVTHAAVTQPQHTSPPPPSNPITPVRTVPIVPPHTESTVQINPPINSGRKVQVTITTQTPSTPPVIKVPATNGNIQQNPQTAPLKSSAVIPVQKNQTTTVQTNKTGNIVPPSAVNPTSQSPAVTTKTVDQVVAQGSDGKPVITIQSDQAHQLTIQQGTTKVTTSLPIQVSTMNHSLGVPSQNQTGAINVLPSEALQGIVNKGILNTRNASKAKVHLTQDTNGVNYTVDTQKQGKLFGVFPVQSPVQVKLSAQSGKIVNVTQPVLFNIFGGFIK
ncbi:MAG TPA: hypothetical protein VGT05_04025 [Patescibacteria group bacterium]|nr:hypothetical protein [Patescibacteria group bacterium]